MKPFTTALVTALLFVLVAAGATAEEGASTRSGDDCPCRYLGIGLPWKEYADPAKLSALIDGKAESYFLIDVRSQAEYAGGHIPTAVNIPVDEIGERPPTGQKDALIIVYCRSGARSARASGILKELGYSGVIDFGGVNRWTGPLVREP